MTHLALQLEEAAQLLLVHADDLRRDVRDLEAAAEGIESARNKVEAVLETLWDSAGEDGGAELT